jgi:hypothetical protein
MPRSKDGELATIFLSKSLKAFAVYPVSIAIYLHPTLPTVGDPKGRLQQLTVFIWGILSLAIT